MLSVLILFILVCTSSTTLALSEHEWRSKIVQTFGSITKYINQRDFVKFRELFSDDTEVLLPGRPLAYKEDFSGKICKDSEKEKHQKESDLIFERFGRKRYLKEYPVNHIYASFVELLFSSPDVAIARVAEFAELIDGSERTAAGLSFFIRDGNEAKVKLGIFTME